MAAESRFVPCVKLREVTIVVYDKADMAGGSARAKRRAGEHTNQHKYTCTYTYTCTYIRAKFFVCFFCVTAGRLRGGLRRVLVNLGCLFADGAPD